MPLDARVVAWSCMEVQGASAGMRGKPSVSHFLPVPWGAGTYLSPWLPLILTSIVKTAWGQAHSPQ